MRPLFIFTKMENIRQEGDNKASIKLDIRPTTGNGERRPTFYNEAEIEALLYGKLVTVSEDQMPDSPELKEIARNYATFIVESVSLTIFRQDASVSFSAQMPIGLEGHTFYSDIDQLAEDLQKCAYGIYTVSPFFSLGGRVRKLLLEMCNILLGVDIEKLFPGPIHVGWNLRVMGTENVEKLFVSLPEEGDHNRPDRIEKNLVCSMSAVFGHRVIIFTFMLPVLWDRFYMRPPEIMLLDVVRNSLDAIYGFSECRVVDVIKETTVIAPIIKGVVSIPEKMRKTTINESTFLETEVYWLVLYRVLKEIVRRLHVDFYAGPVMGGER